MELKREELLERFYARDAANDGEFVVGVVTTGIYCLPSCTARKPKPENVLFFGSEAEARAEGLRACKRCRPDHFYRRYDPDRELAGELARRIREAPGDFPDVSSVVRASGVGSTKLTALFRRQFHASPAGLLLDARVRFAARQLLWTAERVLDVALDAGFESPSAFHENFRRRTGMAPGAYRALAAENELSLRLPGDFRRNECLALFRRNAEGRTERTDGRTAVKALAVGGRAVRLELAFAAGRVRCVVRASGRPGRRVMAEAHEALVRMLGLRADPSAFERRVLRAPGLARLVEGRRGLRIPLTADPFEGLVWVVVGQQVNVGFAAVCRDRLIALCGEDAGAGFLAHPTPQAVAGLDYRDLTRLQYSRRKAEYLIDTARSVVEGSLDLEALARAPADAIRERLGSVRGLGPWSVQYLLMRSFGLDDCVPVGDVGLAASLRSFFGLEDRPDERETLALMEPFAPHRSLATFHLWKRLGDPV